MIGHVCLLNAFMIFASSVSKAGSGIMCVCSTTACKNSGVRNCKTSNMCYTQVLNVWDGSSSITRGCINSQSSLLCENKPPIVEYKRWPSLACCNHGNFCNEHLLPNHSPGSDAATTLTVKSILQTMSMRDVKTLAESLASMAEAERPKITPINMGIMTLGGVTVVLLGVVGYFLIKLQRKQQQEVDEENSKILMQHLQYFGEKSGNCSRARDFNSCARN